MQEFKKVFLIMLVSLVLLSCGLRWEGQGPGPRDEGSPPQILAFHAEQVVRPGETWKVYLRVRDVDCDMTYVITDLWQSGGGSYPVSFTPIKGLPCPELMGYVFLKTPADGDLVWEQFQAKLFVRDRRGNRSNSIQLQLNFDQVSAKKPPEQWRVATVVSIGTLNIEESTYRHHGTSGVRLVASGADGAKPVIGKAQSNRDAFSKMARKESIEK
jgi:hypothetical protein